MNFDYDFIADNNFNKINYNSLNANINVNNFVTSFQYLEERGDIGTKNYIKNQTKYSFDENNSISFSTRENRELDLTEFYNLVYQYENDCLRAALEYNKNFYSDNDVKPEEELLFTLTIVPFSKISSTNIISNEKFNLLFYIIIFILNFKNTYSEKISIIYTVDNEPITNVQINNEITYLKLINKNLDTMEDNSLLVYASKSLLREKIKEIEISKNFKFGLNDELVFQNMENLYRSIGLTNQNEFDNLLKNLNLNKKFKKKKIEIELLWNRLIYEKFKNKLSINKIKSKKILRYEL